MNKPFVDSCARALAEVMQLNQEEGSYRWKTISMASSGHWFADECDSRKLIPNYNLGFYEALIGFDRLLTEKFTETPINDWLDSVQSVPQQ